MAPGASPGKSIVLLAAAVALACVALLVLFGRPASPPPPSDPELQAPAAAGAEPKDEPAAPTGDAPAATPPREPAPPAPRADAAGRPPAPEAEKAAPAGEAPPLLPSGIGLFPPPGTDPIKRGIVVPDDYELPEGYLRHYQVTDDGQELDPILLFHPDYELLDDAGNPVPLPPDRVVPPELAPPGMPIRTVEVPAPLPENAP